MSRCLLMISLQSRSLSNGSSHMRSPPPLSMSSGSRMASVKVSQGHTEVESNCCYALGINNSLVNIFIQTVGIYKRNMHFGDKYVAFYRKMSIVDIVNIASNVSTTFPRFLKCIPDRNYVKVADSASWAGNLGPGKRQKVAVDEIRAG